ncbi:MAG TPA: DUF2314 domain-containing protein [Phycisphaerales bacterium]|nr:DUF2314 domain-containing protein [Phycisphaerales bacterium]
MFRAVILAALTVAMAVGCGKKHDWKEVTDEDPRLEAARQQARDEYPTFVKALKKPKALTLYSAEVMYEANGAKELVSLEVHKATEDEITGAVIGFPTDVKLSSGEIITVPVSTLVDWQIENAEGEKQGGYVAAERVKLQRGG